MPNTHIDSPRERGMVPIVAPDTTREKPRETRLGGPYDFMRRVIATELGGGLYSQRQWMVEPLVAQIKANRRIDRFRRRGTGGRPLGMAPDRGHPQPAQTPPPLTAGHRDLRGLPALGSSGFGGAAPNIRASFARHPHAEAAAQRYRHDATVS
jgi:hypothetical protein